MLSCTHAWNKVGSLFNGPTIKQCPLYNDRHWKPPLVWYKRWDSVTTDKLRCGLLRMVGSIVSQFWFLDKWRVRHFSKVHLEILLDRELEGLCTHNWFYMHQAPLAYMMVFRQVTSPSLCLGNPRGIIDRDLRGLILHAPNAISAHGGL